jgi:RNA polymerase primary sigma factor
MNNKTNTEKLISENRRIVEAVAKQYQNQGLTMEQLIEEGNKGLVKAAERFDESKGFKFLSYAVWWIRQSILEALAATENGEPIGKLHPVLTPRERGILRDIANGESLEQIAADRRITVERVRQIRDLAQRKINHV